MIQLDTYRRVIQYVCTMIVSLFGEDSCLAMHPVCGSGRGKIPSIHHHRTIDGSSSVRVKKVCTVPAFTVRRRHSVPGLRSILRLEKDDGGGSFHWIHSW